MTDPIRMDSVKNRLRRERHRLQKCFHRKPDAPTSDMIGLLSDALNEITRLELAWARSVTMGKLNEQS